MRNLLLTSTTLALLAASTTAGAQSSVDRAFTAKGTGCDQVTWSEDALERFPRIESACQDVMERDGRYYVKFSGTVRRVADRGRRVTVNFDNGSELELTPPEDLALYIDGRPRPVANLRRGDELTFYVPQDNLAAPPAQKVVGLTIIPIARFQVAQATPAESETQTQMAAELPRTAGFLHAMGLGGILLMGFGAWLRRRR